LNVERAASQLRLSWDRNSPPIRDADHGSLWITDGTHRQQLDLDARQLRQGSFAYWPSSRDVNFQLEVFAGGQRVTESVRTLVSGVPAPAADSKAAPASRASQSQGKRGARDRVRVPAAAVTASEAEKPSALGPPAQENRRPENVATATAASANRASPADLEPPPSNTPVTVQPSQTVNSAPVQAATPPREPRAIVTYEPVTASKFRRVISKIPGLRSLQRRRFKQGDRFVPARPVHQVAPKAPPKIVRELASEMPVDVKVYIDETGRVARAEPLATDEEHELTKLARTAAHLWKFAPARLDDEPVPSEMVLHFVFGAEK